MKDNLCNGLENIISQAIEEMKAEQGVDINLDTVNLAELRRRTGISRSRLRTARKKFRENIKGINSVRIQRNAEGVLSGYTGVIDELLKSGITNSVVCRSKLVSEGCNASLSTVKRYISAHRNLVPAKRQAVDSQGNRGRRYSTSPGEAFQMDWGFVNVNSYDGDNFRLACFAMVCHHCGTGYIEFFPNAKQENLFIGMIHAFIYMGIPRYILTDNMKSVVVKRDYDGRPVWQRDYQAFMETVGFNTKLCKPRHPFTKGKVERLVRYVKDNFLAGRKCFNISDLNLAAIEWCNEKNSSYRKAVDCVPCELHNTSCATVTNTITVNDSIMMYLCPERRISFDGFINYEGRRFGVPYTYISPTARIMRKADTIYIYSNNLKQLLTTHAVTWSRKDRFCSDQYANWNQPEEFPTAPVTTEIKQLPENRRLLSFEKFNFDLEGY